MSTPTPISKISRKALREVWPNEASHFTKWLADNLDVLGETVGLDLTLVEREAAAGDFSLDLLAEDERNRTIVIENQLERSDHDHLGKLLTYLAAYDADVAIWIVGNPRPEHTKAIAWLNDSTPAAFYLVRAEAIQIDNSPPALLLTLIVGPSEESKSVARDKQEQSETHQRLVQFWESLLEIANRKSRLHAGVTANQYNWMGTGAGRSGLAWNYVIRKSDWRVELYIDTPRKGLNDAIIQWLQTHTNDIEIANESPLLWDSNPERKACRITSPWALGGYSTPQTEWPALHEVMADAMLRLHRALSQRLQQLPSDEILSSPTSSD